MDASLVETASKTRARPQAEPPLDPKTAARAARLRYVSDKKPGITRHRSGTTFSYRDPDGKPVRDEETLKRIKSLAIPPAWEEVWICPYENGHIQAVGRDGRRRKQYRYHPRWREVRDEAKYGKMLLFGQLLPRIRTRVATDLALPGLSREKVLAAIVRLLETTLIRVGNEEYAKQNKSFGLTTLRDRHARVNGSRILFRFQGKSGIKHEIDLTDRRLARIVKKSQDLPGQELFQYLDENGEVRDVRSEDVNEYLREIAGEEITAKDFRTWAATNLAAIALQELEAVDSKAKMKRNVTKAIEAVAKMLGNTPAICRKCYVHPAVVDGYLDGTLAEALKRRAEAELRDNIAGMKPEEVAVLAFLRHRLGEMAAA
jgi:DNA topoisomerase-1